MKYALVTGGSRGIGRAICVKLFQMGYEVLINYVSALTYRILRPSRRQFPVGRRHTPVNT